MESQGPQDYRYWPMAMQECYFAVTNGGDFRYFTWIGTNYTLEMETHFCCGIGPNYLGQGYVRCFAVGLVL